MTSRKFTFSLLITGLLSFVVLSIFGLGHAGWMTKDENGDMAGCIFTGQMMLCKMSVIEHVSLWQSMFIATAQESSALLTLLILWVAVIFIIKNVLAPPRLSRSAALTKRFYLKKHPNLPFFNPLKKAFSQGILNPKIYNFATL